MTTTHQSIYRTNAENLSDHAKKGSRTRAKRTSKHIQSIRRKSTGITFFKTYTVVSVNTTTILGSFHGPRYFIFIFCERVRGKNLQQCATSMYTYSTQQCFLLRVGSCYCSTDNIKQWHNGTICSFRKIRKIHLKYNHL